MQFSKLFALHLTPYLVERTLHKYQLHKCRNVLHGYRFSFGVVTSHIEERTNQVHSIFFYLDIDSPWTNTRLHSM